MKRIIFVLLTFSLLSAFLQAETDPSHVASIRIESAELCPGQVADLAVYVDLKLGTSEGGSGTYPAGQKAPDPLDNFMFFLYISDTSKLEVVTHDWVQQGPGFYSGLPVLTEVDPAILYRGSFIYNYVVGQPVQLAGKGPVGLFACTWVDGSGGANAFLPDNTKPIFRIRVRCKDQGPVELKFEPSSLAFSTGLTVMGGYYYSFEGPGYNNIHNGTITNGKGPDKSQVRAGKDSVVCIKSRITFNAEGGSSYKWSQVYNPALTGGYQDEYLTNRNTKNPTFVPLKAGAYIYQVQVADQRGCYTTDTVIYSVSQNYIEGSVSPQEILVDSGSSVVLDLKNRTGIASLTPLRVTLQPDSVFPENGNVLEGEAGSLTLSGQLQTLPIREPVLVVATFSDKVCQAESAARIHMRGAKVSGKIAPFPVYRCGNDEEEKTIQLNLLTSGGSGKFLYNWKVNDLEFGEAGDPYISNPNIRNPRLWYIGRCAVSVDVFDMESGETVTISDTMIYRDWLHASVDIVLDTLASGLDAVTAGGPFCENMELTYRAESRFAGDSPSYIWQINGIWVGDREEDSVFTTKMRKGDSVGVILYSSEACVAEAAVQSGRLSPNIHYPSILTVAASNTTPDGGTLADCGDSIRLSVIYRSAGNHFRLQWWRNHRELVYDSRISCANPDSGSYEAILPRNGYFDGYYCTISESDMPCIPFDSVSSECIYLNGGNSVPGWIPEVSRIEYHPSGPLKAGAVKMKGPQAVCEGSEFTLETEVDNLPCDFVLKWYKKAGRDSVLLGYYAYQTEDILDVQHFLEGINDEYDLAGLSGYRYGRVLASMRNVVQDGFKIILNDPNTEIVERQSIAAGDTVYYVVYSTSEVCGRAPHGSKSPYYVPVQLPLVGKGEEQQLTYVEDDPICAGSSATLVASCGELKEFLRYSWTVNGRSVFDTAEGFADRFRISGALNDTLHLLQVFASTEVECRMSSDHDCGANLQQTARFDFQDRVLSSAPFSIRHNPDTVICEGAQIRNWVEVEEYAEYGAVGLRKRKSASAARAQAGAAARSADRYEIGWSKNMEDLFRDGESVVWSAVYEDTPVSNGNAPLGTGDAEDTKGITSYYVRVREVSTGCERYDSVRVLMAHDYPVSVSIDYLLPSPWCDSAVSGHRDPSFLIEGQPYMRGAQYAVLRITNGGASPTWGWIVDSAAVGGLSSVDTLLMSGAPDGHKLSAWVRSSMLTCLPAYATASPVEIRNSVGGTVFADAPVSAVAGEAILLQAFVGRPTDGRMGADSDMSGFGNGLSARGTRYDILAGYDYSWSRLSSEEDWLFLGEGSAQGRSLPDTFRTVMPDSRAVFRVEARDRYGVCPAVGRTLPVTSAVETGVQLKAFDPVSGREISGFCAQTNAFTFSDEEHAAEAQAAVRAEFDRISWVDTDGRDSLPVLLRSYPQNAGGHAYAGFYKNGDLSGVGPVGRNTGAATQSENSFFTLERGDSIVLYLKPGDWVGAFYVHDTVSADGLRTHYSERIDFATQQPEGGLSIEGSGATLCPGETTLLSAGFSGTASPSGPVQWQPAECIDGRTTDWSVRAAPSVTTLYTVTAFDRAACAWRDSVRVQVLAKGEHALLAIKADSLRFCGLSARVKLYIDESVSHAADFERIYWYSLDETGNRILIDSSFGPLWREVRAGERIMAEGRSGLACQKELSLSDTLVFEGVRPPVLQRRYSWSDTTVCPGSQVYIAYAVEPSDAVLEWYDSYDGGDESLVQAGDERWIDIRENRKIRALARRPDMAYCLSGDTVFVRVFEAERVEPSVTVKALENAVCGPVEVTWQAKAVHCDTLIWYANGREILRDALTLVRVPKWTGLEGPADSVVVAGVRAAGLCSESVRTVSAPALVYRVDKPVLTLLCADTTVYEGSVVRLEARAEALDGESPALAWFDSRGVQIARTASVELEMDESDFFRVSARQLPLGTALPECISHDTVRVRVLKPEDPIRPPSDTLSLYTGLYIPNTILPGSSKPADREFRVYGKDILEVSMKVYDPRGYLLFDRMGADAVWRATDMQGTPVEAGLYSYRLKVFLKDGRVIEKKGWVSVLR